MVTLAFLAAWVTGDGGGPRRASRSARSCDRSAFDMRRRRQFHTTRDSASPIWVFASRFCFGGFCFAMEGGLEILVAVRCRAKP